MVELKCVCGEELVPKRKGAGTITIPDPKPEDLVVQDEWVCRKCGNIYRVSDKTGNLYLVTRLQ